MKRMKRMEKQDDVFRNSKKAAPGSLFTKSARRGHELLLYRIR
jgi:hypothetical protein